MASASVSRSRPYPGGCSRLSWLPFDGIGNGLTDQAWVPLADIAVGLLEPLLARLRDARVPAWAALAELRRESLRPASQPDQLRLWVGASAYGRAEEALRVALPELRRAERR